MREREEKQREETATVEHGGEKELTWEPWGLHQCRGLS